jgi:hypothetical protein
MIAFAVAVAVIMPFRQRAGAIAHRRNGYDQDGKEIHDYHFMKQTNTGQWAEKHGPGGDSILWGSGWTPDTIPWTLGDIEYYDSPIIYYAVGTK